MLAAQHIIDECEDRGPLQVEFADEPSYLAGRPITETSYTGFEPWLISLLNQTHKRRYLLVVGPEGDIQGCVVTPMGAFEGMFTPVPQVDEAPD